MNPDPVCCSRRVRRAFRHLCLSFAVALFCLAVCSNAAAQSACPSIADKVKSPPGNMFNAQQEMWLGEVLADYVEHRYRIIQGTREVAYLQSLGDRIVAALPPTDVKYSFRIIDSGQINGFSLAGGRVYIERKLIATAQNEDEVAGVIGHEIGHIITHQSALEISQGFRKQLHITSVGDKADIEAKFHQFLDAEEKHPSGRDKMDDDQGEADYVGVIAAAAAGYAPSALPAFWNRSFFVGNKTGNVLTDILRTTNPNEKRLRGMLQTIAKLPKGCGAPEPVSSPTFAKWHDAVMVKNRTVRQTNDAMQDAKIVPLTPVLRTDLVALRFSHDGKQLLAQNESAVVILDTATGNEIFRFNADNAYPAEWSPDGKTITLLSYGLHLEQWDIEARKRNFAREMVIHARCIQYVLSPDGRSLVCVTQERGDNAEAFDLHVFDTSNNAEVLLHQGFYHINGEALFKFLDEGNSLSGRHFLNTAISQDGNYLVIGSGAEKTALDFRDVSEVPLAGDFKKQISSAFAFQGNRIAGEDVLNPAQSGLFTFPEGKRTSNTTAHLGAYDHVSSGELVLAASPKFGQTIGLNYATGKVLFEVASRTVDAFGDTVAYETPTGDISLADLSSGQIKPLRTIPMPQTNIGELSIQMLSPDGKYLAASARSHGAVWDVATGKRIYNMRGFTGVGFEGPYLFLDTPKHDKSDRAIFRVKVGQTNVEHVDVPLAKNSRIYGGHLVTWISGHEMYTLQVIDLKTGKLQWQRSFHGDAPGYGFHPVEDAILVRWTNQIEGGQAEAAKNADLAKQFAAVKGRKDWLLAELFSLSDGKILRSFATPRPQAVTTSSTLRLVGETIVEAGRDNRVNFFSATDGALLKEVFGHIRSFSGSLGMVCVGNRSDELTVYDLKGETIKHLQVGKNVRSANFDDANKRLIILGADQKLRFVDLNDSDTEQAKN